MTTSLSEKATEIESTPLKVGNKKCDQKKSPNVYKSCRKMTSLEKLDILTPLQKLSKNVGLPKVQ